MLIAVNKEPDVMLLNWSVRMPLTLRLRVLIQLLSQATPMVSEELDGKRLYLRENSRDYGATLACR